MSSSFTITGRQVDVSVPTRTVIHNADLAQALKQDWSDTVQNLGSAISPVSSHSVAVDEYGRVIVFDPVFNQKIRGSLERCAAAANENTNLCGCDGGHCNLYRCGG